MDYSLLVGIHALTDEEKQQLDTLNKQKQKQKQQKKRTKKHKDKSTDKYYNSTPLIFISPHSSLF
jgi:protein-disulfide isomerase